LNPRTVLLRDNSGAFFKDGVAREVELTATSFNYTSPKKGLRTFELKDIIGAKHTTIKNVDYLIIFHYLKRTPKIIYGSVERYADHLKFAIKAVHREASQQIAKTWEYAIQAHLRGLSFDPCAIEFNPIPRREILVFINPYGGKRNSVNIYETKVRPMLEEANINPTTIITERQYHASHYVATENIRKFSAIISIGGDGMLAEVFDGIKAREDMEEVLRSVAVGIIPGGSGNGLAKSILFESNEEYNIISSVFVIIKCGSCVENISFPMEWVGASKPRDMDLSVITTHTNKNYLCFLSLAWAIISDVDIESEKWRWMGSARFTFGAVIKILNLRSYPARLSFLPANTQVKVERDTSGKVIIPALTEPLPNNWETIEDRFVMVWIVQTSHATHDMYVSPQSRIADGMLHIVMIRHGVSRVRLLSLFTKLENGEHVNDDKVEIYAAFAYRLEPLTNHGLYSMDGEVIDYGPIQATVWPHAGKVLSIAPNDSDV